MPLSSLSVPQLKERSKQARKRRKLPNGAGSIERVKYTPEEKIRVKQYRAMLAKPKVERI